MRKLPLFLLMASVAMPALAAPGDDDRGNRRNRGNDASEQSENRQQRSIENRRPDGNEQRVRADRPDRQERTERAQESRQNYMERLRGNASEQRQQRAQTAVARSNDDNDNARNGRRGDRNDNDGVRNGRRGDRDGNASSSNWRPRERVVRTIPDNQPRQVSQGRRGSGEIARAYDGRRRPDYRNGDYRRWTNNWRNDNRYDWRRWRDGNRSLFRVGSYYDPFGWSYRRWSIGSFLFPSYYGSRYWMNDPWHYRLPPAYGPYRWVRYWDDAIMVNIYTGQVEDVIHNFFW